MEKSFGGGLARVEVPDLLTFLNISRRTGALLMEREEQQTTIFFREGQPIFGNSNKEGLRFPDMLVRLGKLRAEQLQQIVAQHRATGQHIGQVLVAQALLSDDELISYLKVQVSEVVFDTFGWHAGSFSFYDDVAPPDYAVTLKMDVQNLIMEGVRRGDVRDRLAQVFKDLNLVVELVSSRERVKQSVTLTPEEWQVYFLVDNRRSLSEVCQIAGNPDELATLEILHRLVEANLIAVVPPGASPAEAEEPAPGTAHVKAGAAPAEAPKVTMAPVPANPPHAQDDSRKIVSPQAVEYVGGALVMGRLVLTLDGREVSFPLTRDSHAIGRNPNNDIVVDDAKVSAFHARIDRRREGFLLVDLNSTNGTFLNGKRISMRLLRAGDEVRLGPVRLRFVVDQDSAEPERSAKDRTGSHRRRPPAH